MLLDRVLGHAFDPLRQGLAAPLVEHGCSVALQHLDQFIPGGGLTQQCNRFRNLADAFQQRRGQALHPYASLLAEAFTRAREQEFLEQRVVLVDRLRARLPETDEVVLLV